MLGLQCTLSHVQSGQDCLTIRSGVPLRLPRIAGLQGNKGSRKIASTIIGSHDEAHSAIQLCESESSLSSDSVSFVEGVYCDMDTKAAWPLCRGIVKRECYEWKTHVLVGKDGTMTEKVYEYVQQWD